MLEGRCTGVIVMQGSGTQFLWTGRAMEPEGYPYGDAVSLFPFSLHSDIIHLVYGNNLIRNVCHCQAYLD